MRNVIRAGLITLAALTLAAAHGAPVARTQLPNGLTVIAAPGDASRIAGIAVVIGSSMADEPAGLRGARAMLQQLIVLSSHQQINEQLTPISSFIDARSSGLGVNTDWEFVEAALAVHVEELDAGLQLLAGQVFGAQITQEQFDEARELVKRGYDISHESPVQDTFDLFRRAFYGAGPMGRSLQGDPDSIDAMTLEGLQAFRDAQYVAADAVVCVVAPMSADEITAAVTAAFGALPTLPAPPAAEVPAPPPDSRVEAGDAAGLVQASMVVGVPLPPVDDPKYIAGEMVGQLLDGRGGRLRRDLSLLQALGLAIPTRLLEQHYPIGVLPMSMSRQPFLAVHALCSPNTIEQVRRGLLRHLLALRTGGVTDAELERARRRVINGHLLANQRPVERALYLAGRGLFGLGDVDQAVAAAQAVTADDLIAVVDDYFGRHAVGVQMPAS